MLDICITLVNTNEKNDIDQSLSTLLADSKDSGLSIGIVIVDNGSSEDIEPLLKEKFPQATLIRKQCNEGFGKSHNTAMQAVAAKYYFILNPDTTFPPGQQFLKRLYEFMEVHPQVGVAGPKILYPDGSLQYSCYRFPTFWQPLYSRTKLGVRGRGQAIASDFLMKRFDHARTMPVDWVMGSAMFVRGASIAQVGMFDERFWMYAEDSDWCRRMWEKNWAVYYVHDVMLQHVHKRASAKVPGVINALLKNKYARVHFISWLKYFWKWRGNHKYYGIKG